MTNQAPSLEKSEVKDYFKKIIEPIITGNTTELFPTDGSFTKWCNLHDNVEVFLRSATGDKLKKGQEADKIVQAEIDKLLEEKKLIIS